MFWMEKNGTLCNIVAVLKRVICKLSAQHSERICSTIWVAHFFHFCGVEDIFLNYDIGGVDVHNYYLYFLIKNLPET